jgi:hypothetical protein
MAFGPAGRPRDGWKRPAIIEKEGIVIRKRIALCLLPVLMLVGSACTSAQRTGNISGRLVYAEFGKEASQEAMANVRIILCHVDRGLPDGPVVGNVNKGRTERIGVIKAGLAAVTDETGKFTITGVPTGSYLVLLDLAPAAAPRPPEDSWDGMILTEADVDNSLNGVSPSGKADFWMGGGFFSGTGDWSSEKGFVFKEGMVGSKTLALFFSVKDQRPYPVVEVRADSTVEVALESHIKPGEVKS